MLDKDPAFQHLIKNTNLEVELAKAKLDLVDKISVGKDVIKIGVNSFFFFLFKMKIFILFLRNITYFTCIQRR